jgi:hypothetical protein
MVVVVAAAVITAAVNSGYLDDACNDKALTHDTKLTCIATHWAPVSALKYFTKISPVLHTKIVQYQMPS